MRSGSQIGGLHLKLDFFAAAVEAAVQRAERCGVAETWIEVDEVLGAGDDLILELP